MYPDILFVSKSDNILKGLPFFLASKIFFFLLSLPHYVLAFQIILFPDESVGTGTVRTLSFD